MSTNGYVGLDESAKASYSSDNVTVTSGRAISVFNADNQQNTGGNTTYISGFTKYWSNADTFVLQYTGYSYVGTGSVDVQTQLRFQIKFYTNQAYADAKITPIDEIKKQIPPSIKYGIKVVDGNTILNRDKQFKFAGRNKAYEFLPFSDLFRFTMLL